MGIVRIVSLVIAASLQALWLPAALAGERTPVVTGMRDGGRIAVGGAHSCVIGSDGNVRCWGENGSGQIGGGTTIDRPIAVAVSNLTQVTAIAAGANHTCAIRSAGTVHCWGSSASDQIGPGTSNRSLPLQVTGLVDMIAITAGDRHTCALDVQGGSYAAGATTHRGSSGGQVRARRPWISTTSSPSGPARNTPAPSTYEATPSAGGATTSINWAQVTVTTSVCPSRCPVPVEVPGNDSGRVNWRLRSHRGRRDPHLRSAQSRACDVLGVQHTWTGRWWRERQ